MTLDGSPPTSTARRPRSGLMAIVLGFALVFGLMATGVADAAEHALAHAFPSMDGGCGGG